MLPPGLSCGLSWLRLSNKLGQISRYGSCCAVALYETRSTLESKFSSKPTSFAGHYLEMTKHKTHHQFMTIIPASVFHMHATHAHYSHAFLPPRHLHSVFLLLHRIT